MGYTLLEQTCYCLGVTGVAQVGEASTTCFTECLEHW